MPIPGQPWESVRMDFSGLYPEVKGFNYILLVICQMTNMVHIIPTRTDVTAKQVAELYVKEIVRLHGIPESVVSDWDTKFTSQFWTELSRLLEQRLLMSLAYHPQTDGSSERVIQTMSQVLRALVLEYSTSWVDQLPLVEFAMNSAVHESTGYTPFKLNYGWLPRMIRGIGLESSRDSVCQFVENINNVLDKTFNKLLTQHTRQAIEADPDEEWVIHLIEDHRWSPDLKFLVRWELGDTSWEPLKVVDELEALDHYLN
ncbi:hypothetical protein AX14_013058 [Amanita brunnescens Koide BX004]|nr:hypothetical protein AX14_013716 [Amanita brunnescens Koide BX004]KAF8712488.1 hypothetical protein AX14_013058 [Amanita brunnescens Koide BX004]